MTKKILITGSSGQLGYDLQKTFANENLILFDLPKFDVTKKRIIDQITKKRPEIIIHAAAYTDVDGAEKNQKKVFLINQAGTKNVTSAAKCLQAILVYISTDYVFDGCKKAPYKENDHPHPLNIYGKSKLAGEYEIKRILKHFFIVRTSWLCGIKGKNFIKTILKLAKEKDQIKVVNDQIGSPTFTFDLAQAIKYLIPTQRYGIYHISSLKPTSWYYFAKKILEIKKNTTKILPIKSQNFPRPANRPRYSYLSKDKFHSLGKFIMPSWEQSLVKYLGIEK